MRGLFATLLEVAGAACVVAGIAVWAWPAALVVAGVFLVVGAQVIER